MTSSTERSSRKDRLFRKGDILIITAIPGIAVILSVLFCLLSPKGGEAVLLRYEGGEKVLSLSEDADLEIVSRGHTLRISVRDGGAFFADSTCRDKVCVHTGKIGPDGGTFAACLPAGVTLTLTGERGTPDAVAY